MWLLKPERLIMAFALGRFLFGSLELGLAQPRTWVLSAEPLVTIGPRLGPMGEFARVGLALSGPRGEIAVSNSASQEIRIFSRDGRFLRSLGRAGDGPGEFRSLWSFFLAGDTLFVPDEITSRVTMFRWDGPLMGTYPIAARSAIGRYSVNHRLADGRFVVSTMSTPTLDGPQRVYRDTTWVGLLSRDGTALRWLGAFPGRSFFVYNPSNGPRGMLVGVDPLAPALIVSATRDHVLIGDMADGALREVDTMGVALRQLTLPFPPEPFEKAELAQAIRERVAAAESDAQRTIDQAMFSAPFVPATKPRFGDVVVGVGGEIWIRPWRLGGSKGDLFTILDPLGVPIASLQGPRRFRLDQVGPDYLVGVAKDDDDVETGVVYGLRRTK